MSCTRGGAGFGGSIAGAGSGISSGISSGCGCGRGSRPPSVRIGRDDVAFKSGWLNHPSLIHIQVLPMADAAIKSPQPRSCDFFLARLLALTPRFCGRLS